MITQPELHRLLSYDPDTGVFIKKTSWKVKAGSVAGTLHSSGYYVIGIKGRLYKLHRLAWLYVYGELPTGQVDHRNRIKTDNRINNLRVVTNPENAHNIFTARLNNKSGVRGVCLVKRKWRAMISVKGKQIRLGRFDTKEEAGQAYLDAKRIYHPSAFHGDAK